MTRIVYNTATSLNGFIADEENSLDWLFAVESGEAPDHDAFMREVGVIVEGATTYEWVLDSTKLLEHPDKWSSFFGDHPTFVFTSRDLPIPEGADVRLVSGDVEQHLDDIVRAASGLDVWLVGGGELVGQFYDIGALDEIQVSIAPTALTGGAPLFPRDTDPGDLELTEVKRYGGFAHLCYTVHPASD
ncbi:dihydrofolate reductase family protein [Paramicrobacterium agarici]|uniref:Dihydrofolate reductase n=1 Tax=Paramicrobacterium agarici TaxID=630514 RepID=A0A2A9DVG8_9MICO|nr:dihydrofolate reductase family protein [Microbacterium agarici]PFG30356.1 dihydrofolate reductase [Microbacterium agarici]TQO23369.1 dihydrofolate reductase [Microbacterium agarici]